MPKSNLNKYKTKLQKKTKTITAEEKVKSVNELEANNLQVGYLKKTLFFVLPLLFTFLVYLNSLNGDFLNWDDDRYVTGNKRLELTFDNVKYYFTEPYFVMYIPLTMLSYMIDYGLGGLDKPWVYHLHNLVLHLLNTALVWIFVFLLLRKNKQAIYYAFLSALFFGLHPLHTESVSWIAERKDVLYAFWFLLSMIFYLRYRDLSKKGFYFLSFAAYILSLLAKTQAVVLPVVLLLIDYFRGDFDFTKEELLTFLKFRELYKLKRLWEKIPHFILAFVFGLIAVWASGTSEPFSENLNTKQKIAVNTDYSAFESLVYASYSLTMYFVKSLVPYKQAAIHPYPYDNGQMPVWFYSYLLFPVIFTVLLLYLIIKKQKIPAFGLLFFIVTIGLMLHIKNFVISEHYAYLPTIGLGLFLFYYLLNLSGKLVPKYVVWGAVSVYFSVFALLTFQRNKVFENSLTFWNDIERKYPNVIVTYYNRGNYFQKLGDLALSEGQDKKAVNFYRKALDDYNKAIELHRFFVGAYSNRGITEAKLGLYKKAIEDFNKVISIDSNFTDVYSNRGNAYALLGQWDKAISDYTKAIERKPAFADAYYNRGVAYMNTGKYNLAVEDFSETISLKPEYTEAYKQRAIAYFLKNSYDSALADINFVLAKDPSDSYFLFYRALLYDLKGDKISAGKDFKKLRNNNPALIKDFIGIAQTFENEYFATGKKFYFEKAEQIYNAILKIYPEAKEVYLYRGIFYGQMQDFKKAISQFDRALSIDNQYVDAYINRGYAYFLSGDIKHALEDYNFAEKLDSSKYDVYYNRGLLWANLKSYQKALKDLTKALSLQPDFANAYFERAKIYLRLSDFDKACEDFQKALNLSIRQASYFFNSYCKK